VNEAETRAELIGPALREAGWGVVEDSRIQREFSNTHGSLQAAGKRGKRQIAGHVRAHYLKEGVDELDGEKLSPLLKLKYNNAIAVADLGKPELIKNLFFGFQKYLHQGAEQVNS
jgi:type I restriction enzyme R subunit